jgi:hypothetical protein
MAATARPTANVQTRVLAGMHEREAEGGHRAVVGLMTAKPQLDSIGSDPPGRGGSRREMVSRDFACQSFFAGLAIHSDAKFVVTEISTRN